MVRLRSCLELQESRREGCCFMCSIAASGECIFFERRKTTRPSIESAKRRFEHFYSVVRYVERNTLRAGLVEHADEWRWGSLRQRAQNVRGPLLGNWPLPQPSDGAEYVNLPQTETECAAIRRCLRRGSPYGNATWSEQTAEQLGLQSTMRGRGRPRKDNP
jgi:hypothetical protein